ncbi:hypothetical protein AB0K09_29290 [Streptomyces sp. NPDC049577]|uniref:hypothetical protein n=1 Tax=Streptomyces sp. NPDC049577 TaxID=3155153 RepID=UPI003446FD66
MWPGQQPPGGAQNPQQPNPYQQPGPQQPNPYQQPGYQQQPNPYQQPAVPPATPQPGPYGQPSGQFGQPGQPGQPGAPQWQAEGTLPGAPRPPENRGKRTTVIAITAAVAVVAAAVVTGVVVLGDDGKDDGPGKNEAKASASAPAASSSASASPGGGAGDPEDNPRAGGEVKPVVPGWKAVVNGKRHDVFDVPPDWTVGAPNALLVYQDNSSKADNPPGVGMSGVAYYKEDVCAKNDTRGAAGTKGAQGAKGDGQEAAETEALNWVWARFDQKKTGKFSSTKAKPFKSDHGISGYTATATVTGVQKTDGCVTDGKSVTVTYKDSNGDFATWCLFSPLADKDEIPDDTIKKIMSSLRPLASS